MKLLGHFKLIQQSGLCANVATPAMPFICGTDGGASLDICRMGASANRLSSWARIPSAGVRISATAVIAANTKHCVVGKKRRRGLSLTVQNCRDAEHHRYCIIFNVGLPMCNSSGAPVADPPVPWWPRSSILSSLWAVMLWNRFCTHKWPPKCDPSRSVLGTVIVIFLQNVSNFFRKKKSFLSKLFLVSKYALKEFLIVFCACRVVGL